MKKEGKGELKLLFLAAFLIFGFYYLNRSLKFLTIPEVINNISGTLDIVAGVLLVIGGIFSMMALKKTKSKE